MRYLELYWNSAGEAGHALASVGPTAAASVSPFLESGEKRQIADVSPTSSISGNLSQFTPDSATSPHLASSSPQPTTKSQNGREEGMGTVKKAKSRTAFSQEQLQTLHQRFQSQKYLSPQKIQELAAALKFTYQQVNMEALTHGEDLVPEPEDEAEKVPEAYILWTAWAQCLMQVRTCGQLNRTQNSLQPNTSLDVYPNFHQGYPITAASNIQMMPTPYQHYRAVQNAYTIVTSEDGGAFGKCGSTRSVQRTVGCIAQHKVDFYHSYPGSVEYLRTKTGNGYNFHHSAPMGAPFPTSAGQHFYDS